MDEKAINATPLKSQPKWWGHAQHHRRTKSNVDLKQIRESTYGKKT